MYRGEGEGTAGRGGMGKGPQAGRTGPFREQDDTETRTPGAEADELEPTCQSLEGRLGAWSSSKGVQRARPTSQHL